MGGLLLRSLVRLEPHLSTANETNANVGPLLGLAASSGGGGGLSPPAPNHATPCWLLGAGSCRDSTEVQSPQRWKNAEIPTPASCCEDRMANWTFGTCGRISLLLHNWKKAETPGLLEYCERSSFRLLFLPNKCSTCEQAKRKNGHT
jgi:hypothetical protein